VGAELLLPCPFPITLIALPRLAAEDNDRASVGRLARRAREGREGEEDAGRVRRVWLISGSIGDAGAFASRSRGLEGQVDIEAEEGEVGRERCSMLPLCFLLPSLCDVRGDEAQGKRGRVALRW
jgi:hypothetical protein